jgi:cell wall-associated NlpC family hydrolase
VRPGDLLFFQITGDAPSHVGMYVGDLDGDGRGDMIHAATPELGVIFESNVFGSSFWSRVYWGARRMPGFPY